MICPACHEENLEQSKFCSHCGAELPPEEVPGEPAASGTAAAAAGGDAAPTHNAGTAGARTSSGTMSGTGIGEPPKKKNNLIWILGCSCAALLIFLLLATVGAFFGYKYFKNKSAMSRPTSAASDIPANPKFVNATMCGRLGPHKEPVDNKTEFAPRARVNCSVEVKDQAVGDVIRACWFKGSEKLTEQNHTQKQPLYDYVAFYIYKTGGLPAGDDYRVEIYINDDMVASKDFSVESGSSATEGKLGSYIEEVVLCSAFEDNYKPVDPTEQFGVNDVFRCSVLVKDLPSGTKANARWYFGTQYIAEGAVTSRESGEQYIGFFCKPKTQWPAGAYRVEIYFNSHLVETKSFTVSE